MIADNQRIPFPWMWTTHGPFSKVAVESTRHNQVSGAPPLNNIMSVKVVKLYSSLWHHWYAGVCCRHPLVEQGVLLAKVLLLALRVAEEASRCSRDCYCQVLKLQLMSLYILLVAAIMLHVTNSQGAEDEGILSSSAQPCWMESWQTRLQKWVNWGYGWHHRNVKISFFDWKLKILWHLQVGKSHRWDEYIAGAKF